MFIKNFLYKNVRILVTHFLHGPRYNVCPLECSLLRKQDVRAWIRREEGRASDLDVAGKGGRNASIGSGVGALRLRRAIDQPALPTHNSSKPSRFHSAHTDQLKPFVALRPLRLSPSQCSPLNCAHLFSLIDTRSISPARTQQMSPPALFPKKKKSKIIEYPFITGFEPFE